MRHVKVFDDIRPIPLWWQKFIESVREHADAHYTKLINDKYLSPYKLVYHFDWDTHAGWLTIHDEKLFSLFLLRYS